MKHKNPFLQKIDVHYCIERMLRYYKENPNHTPTHREMFDLDGLFATNQNLFAEALRIMHAYAVFEVTAEAEYRYRLLQKGYDIIEMGGWNKFRRHERIDRNLKKWQRIAFWPLTIGAIASAAFGVYNTLSVKADITNTKAGLDSLTIKVGELRKSTNQEHSTSVPQEHPKVDSPAHH